MSDGSSHDSIDADVAVDRAAGEAIRVSSRSRPDSHNQLQPLRTLAKEQSKYNSWR